jgi:hypothetical protein
MNYPYLYFFDQLGFGCATRWVLVRGGVASALRNRSVLIRFDRNRGISRDRSIVGYNSTRARKDE